MVAPVSWLNLMIYQHWLDDEALLHCMQPQTVAVEATLPSISPWLITCLCFAGQATDIANLFLVTMRATATRFIYATSIRTSVAEPGKSDLPHIHGVEECQMAQLLI